MESCKTSPKNSQVQEPENQKINEESELEDDGVIVSSSIVDLPQTKNESSIYSPSNIPFSEKTLSDEVFLQYLHDSPPIDILFVFYSIFWIILLI